MLSYVGADWIDQFRIQNQLFKPPFPCSFLLPFFCLRLVNIFDEDGDEDDADALEIYRRL